MGDPLRVLMVEDSEDDAILILRELRRGGFDPAYERVDNAGDMQEALRRKQWDLVLADHNMPNFSAPAALKLLKESGVELPFIIISGSIGDALGVESMKEGASDFIMKDNPTRLVPAIKRSLQEMDIRKKQVTAETALQDSEQKFRTLFHNANDVICLYRLDERGMPGHFMEVNYVASQKLGYSRDELLEMTPLHLVRDGDRENLGNYVQNILVNGQHTLETYFVGKNGRRIPFEISSHVFSMTEVISVISICRDITERKLAEREQKQSVERLRKTMEGIIQMTGKTIEARDPYTAGHQRSVSRLGCAIARELALPEQEIDGIRLACEIHDLGKIYVPAEILTRPGKISSIEFDIIRAHPQVGFDILRTIEFPWPIAEIVAQHHERLDGSGYPLGLAGKDISQGARILAVADVVEAMASHRPYRPALGVDVALEEILKNDHSMYDPDVVEACLKLFREGNYNLDGKEYSV